MSLIACTDLCVYQKDGYCSLSRAASSGQPGIGGCVNFVPCRLDAPGSVPSQQGGQCLSDVGHPDQF